jgi:hypothetical protein
MSADCFRLSPPHQQQHAGPASHAVINSVAWSPVDPKFADALFERLAVAKVSSRKPVDSDGDLGRRPLVAERREPITEDILARFGDVPQNIPATAL